MPTNAKAVKKTGISPGAPKPSRRQRKAVLAAAVAKPNLKSFPQPPQVSQHRKGRVMGSSGFIDPELISSLTTHHGVPEVRNIHRNTQSHDQHKHTTSSRSVGLPSEVAALRSPMTAAETRELGVVSRAVKAEVDAQAHASKAALAAILPHNYTSRYQAGWSNTPTAVAAPFNITTVDFSVPKGATAELDSGNFFCAVSRDPLNATILYVPNPTAQALNYTAEFAVCAADSTPVISDKVNVPIIIGGLQLLNPCSYRYSSGIKAHGAIMYTRSSRGDETHKYTYMTKNEVFYLRFTHPTTGLQHSVTADLIAYRWNGTSVSEHSTTTISATSDGAFTAPESGNFAFALTFLNPTPLDPNSVDVRVWLYANTAGAGPGPNSVHSHLGHLPLAGISTRFLLSAIRCNGRSLMITPDSSLMARGGRTAGAQVDTTFAVEGFVKNAAGRSATSMVQNMDSSVTMDFDMGCYAWHKPRSQSAYKRMTPFLHNNDFDPRAIDGASGISSIANYKSEIEPPDGWLVYAVTVPASVIGVSPDITYPGGLVHVTDSYSCEYWHYDIWIPRSLPALGAEEYEEMMELVGTAPQFHTNALHIEDLKKWYNAASPVVRAIAPSLFKLLRMIGGPTAQGANIAQAVGQLLPDQV